jgi:hypothetical protein
MPPLCQAAPPLWKLPPPIRQILTPATAAPLAARIGNPLSFEPGCPARRMTPVHDDPPGAFEPISRVRVCGRFFITASEMFALSQSPGQIAKFRSCNPTFGLSAILNVCNIFCPNLLAQWDHKKPKLLASRRAVEIRIPKVLTEETSCPATGVASGRILVVL